MPSTETRRYADLITLIREAVNNAAVGEELSEEEVYQKIWALASKGERDAILTFCSWFQQKV